MIVSRLSEIRQRKDLTQSDVAKHLKITQQTYSSYETGKRQMNFETLCMLADFYEVSTDYLLGRQDAIPSFLNEEERGIVDKYRALGEHAKGAIKNSIDFEYSRTPKAKGTKLSVM